MRWRPAALVDLDAIFDHIVDDDPAAALRVVTRIRTRCADLLEYLRLGPARDDLGAGIRLLIVPRLAAAAYRAQPDAIEIVRVFYAGQDMDALRGS